MRDALFAFVVNSAWQSTLIAGAGLAMARLLPAARQRFQLLALTLAAAVAAPALTFAPRRPVAVVALATVQSRGGGFLALLYLAGLAFISMRLLVAALRARRLLRASTPFRGRTRLSPAIAGPVTIGRTVLLPSRLARDRSLLAAALAHEHAHVRRHDYVLHVALELCALPLYFHPMTRLLRRAIADAREMACDDAAAARRGRRAYAAALVRLASTAGAMTMAMGATSIEKRVVALLDKPDGGRPVRRSRLLILPIVLAIACTRFNAAPAVEQASLCGRWALIREASNLNVDAFVQTIEQGPTRVAVSQQRTRHGRTDTRTWRVITDGVTRPIDGLNHARGSATWKDGQLQLRLAGPGAHRETAVAFIRDGRLVCEGKSANSSYHAEFRRIDP